MTQASDPHVTSKGQLDFQWSFQPPYQRHEWRTRSLEDMSAFAAQARSATQQLGVVENTGKPFQASFCQLCIVELIIVPIREGCLGMEAVWHVGTQLFAGMGTCSENVGYDYFIKVSYELRITFSPL